MYFTSSLSFNYLNISANILFYMSYRLSHSNKYLKEKLYFTNYKTYKIVVYHYFNFFIIPFILTHFGSLPTQDQIDLIKRKRKPNKNGSN